MIAIRHGEEFAVNTADPRLLQEEVANRQRVHPGAIEATNCVGGTAHNRLTFDVERRVEHAWHASTPSERLDQIPESRIHVPPHGLWTCGVIRTMQSRSDLRPPFGEDLERHHHERRIDRIDQIVACPLGED